MPRTFFENKELRKKRIDTIINTSLRLFALYGHKKVTIDMIVKECRYSHGLFYHYFSSKQEVLKEIKKRSNDLFSSKIISISKKVPLGLPFLREVFSIIIDCINKGNEENYYVHLLFSTKISELNDGVKTSCFNKEISKMFIESIETAEKQISIVSKKELFKKYLVLFLIAIDGMSSTKIQYPNLFKKKIDADLLFDKFLGFVKADDPIPIEYIS